MSALIQIPAADIAIDGVEVDVVLAPSWLEQVLEVSEVSIPSAGRTTCRLTRSGDDVLVRGRVVVCLVLPCVRCLEPAPADVDAELSLLLRPLPRAELPGKRRGGKRREPEHEITAEEADLDVYDGEMVILDGFVREAILLELPNFPLCSESCPGIHRRPAPPDEAAQPPAVDPRLAPLSMFRAEGDGGPTTIEDLVMAAQRRRSSLRQQAGNKLMLQATTRRGIKRKSKR